MSIDIEILLWLQQLRNSLGGALDEIFNGISKVSVVVMPLLPAIVYWCLSRKWGKRFLATIWLGEVVNGLIKLTVCAYRPWIRSDLIEPAGDSKVAATGYSFPSGHTMCATSTYGNLFVWQHGKRKWIGALCAILILLTMFSRLILGVHTPQDVIVGFIETSLIIVFTGFIFRWSEGNKTRRIILDAAAVFLSVATLVYIQVKSYPMDYVDGQLLVDPLKMMKDCFSGCGGLLGLVIGLQLDRGWIRYEIPQNSRLLAPVTAIGAMLLYSWREYFAGATVVLLLGRNWGNFFAGLLEVVFITAIFPLIIRKMCSDKDEQYF